jgi:hypothetical protein
MIFGPAVQIGFIKTSQLSSLPRALKNIDVAFVP